MADAAANAKVISARMADKTCAEPANRIALRRGVRPIFTGPGPCGKQKYWCGPWFGFTGKICTPSVAERSFLHRGKFDYIGPRSPRPNLWASLRLESRTVPRSRRHVTPATKSRCSSRYRSGTKNAFPDIGSLPPASTTSRRELPHFRDPVHSLPKPSGLPSCDNHCAVEHPRRDFS